MEYCIFTVGNSKTMIHRITIEAFITLQEPIPLADVRTPAEFDIAAFCICIEFLNFTLWLQKWKDPYLSLIMS